MFPDACGWWLSLVLPAGSWYHDMYIQGRQRVVYSLSCVAETLVVTQRPELNRVAGVVGRSFVYGLSPVALAVLEVAWVCIYMTIIYV